MHKVIFFTLILFSLLTSCQKEEPLTEKNWDTHPQVKIVYIQCDDAIVTLDSLPKGYRFGNVYKAWFRTTWSSDNVIATNGNVPREHKAVNQANAEYSKFEPTGEQPYTQNGVYHWPYFQTIAFLDGTVHIDTVSVGYTDGQAFTDFPVNNNNLLFNGHPANYVTWTINAGKRTLNPYRDSKINLGLPTVAYNKYQDNAMTVLVDYFYPRDRTTNVFNPGHRY